MPTVSIDGNTYDVYADVDEADEYLAADFSATAWRAEADPDQKARALVSATRTLDRFNWPGDKYDADQALDWPRTGTGLDGVEDDVVPQEIVDASIVLAKLIHAGTFTTASSSSASNIKRQQAGSVSIEYFNPLLITDPTKLPSEVWDLISWLLAGANVLGGAIAYGTCTPSGFDPDYSVAGPH